jgi:hypothetical protein
MSVSRRNGLYIKTGAFKGSRSRAIVLRMTALKQLAFSLAFAIAAVAAAQYVMWILNGQP